jgi:hypothetical protein
LRTRRARAGSRARRRASARSWFRAESRVRRPGSFTSAGMSRRRSKSRHPTTAPR